MIKLNKKTIWIIVLLLACGLVFSGEVMARSAGPPGDSENNGKVGDPDPDPDPEPEPEEEAVGDEVELDDFRLFIFKDGFRRKRLGETTESSAVAKPDLADAEPVDRPEDLVLEIAALEGGTSSSEPLVVFERRER